MLNKTFLNMIYLHFTALIDFIYENLKTEVCRLSLTMNVIRNLALAVEHAVRT